MDVCFSLLRGLRDGCLLLFADGTAGWNCQRFFSQRCVNLWNSLPAELVTATDLQSFKRGQAEAIPDKLFGYV